MTTPAPDAKPDPVYRPRPTRAPTAGEIDPAAPSDADEGIFGLPFTEDEASVVLVPVPWEPTTSYRRGTAKGPAAIRAASAQVDLFDIELATLGLARPWSFGIHMRGEAPELRALASAIEVAASPREGDHGPRAALLERLRPAHARYLEALTRVRATWGSASGEGSGAVGDAGIEAHRA